jgi:HEAT repeat protein
LTVNELLSVLVDEDEPLKYSELLQVSGLSGDETQEFKAAWGSVPQMRKHELVGKLIELSEDNVELDFSGVFRACLEDSDEDVREQATRGLWESEDRAMIRPLIGLLRGDPSAKVRAAAGASLARFATMAQDGKLTSRDADRIRDALMDVIGEADEEMEVKRRAIEVVASFNSPAVDEIINGAYRSSDPKLVQSSIYAMGQSSNPQWLPTLLIEIENEDAAIRYEAANASGALGDESTVPTLIQLLQDDDTQVQLAAVRSLGEIGGPLAKRALQQCTKIGDEALEAAAQEALSSVDFDDDPLGFRLDV